MRSAGGVNEPEPAELPNLRHGRSVTPAAFKVVLPNSHVGTLIYMDLDYASPEATRFWARPRP
jgi:hypothetical protein